MRKNPEIVIWFSEIGIFLLEKMAGGGAPCGRAEGVYIAMGIRVFGVRGSNGTSTEKGITVAFFSGNSFRSSGGRNPEKQEE